MIDGIQVVFITLFTLGVLVTFHEYGHFWVARRNGVKVLRFSIGFGSPLVRWYDRHGTEVVIAALPLGGYVKMLDEREGEVDPAELGQAFTQKSVAARIAVVLAGPLANLALAVVVLWAVFMGGERGIAPVVAAVEPSSLAARAGLEAGMEIVAIDGEETPTWQAVHLRLLERIGESGALEVAARYRDAAPEQSLIYDSEIELQDWLKGEEEPDLIKSLGLEMYRPQVTLQLAKVVPDSPAAAAGLLAGDEILMVNGKLIASWDAWVDYVRERPEQQISIGFNRSTAGDVVKMQFTELTPALHTAEDGEQYGRVGVLPEVEEWPEDMLRDYEYSLGGAFVAAVKRTGELCMFTLDAMKKMLFGQISAKNLSGPITIAKVAADSAESGLASYLRFLALLSVSLGVLNLLPIPVLDGGHLLYYLCEWIKGSPLPESVQIAGQQLGLLIIVGVMMFAIYNDFARL